MGISQELQRMHDIKTRAENMSNEELVRNFAEARESGDKNAMRVLNKEAGYRTGEYKRSNGCFITTAVCTSFGKPDNCYELSSFRNFRDNWLVNQPDGKSLIAEYYNIAPGIVKRINALPNAKEIYLSIWEKYLAPCLNYIEQEKLADCKNRYVQMVRDLAKKFGM